MSKTLTRYAHAMLEHEQRERRRYQRGYRELLAEAILHPNQPHTWPSQPCRVCGEQTHSINGDLDLCLYHAMYDDEEK